MTDSNHDDYQKWMDAAIDEARLAQEGGDVPVGCVVVKDGQIIARGHNRREAAQDPTAHAELLALREAAKVLGHWRLSGCTVVVTLEPCTMCAGSLVLSRVEKLVYGATDPKAGGCKSLYQIPTDPRLNHKVEIVSGISAETCGNLLRIFFRRRRS
jgi:tRNA(adenine34) deaminase